MAIVADAARPVGAGPPPVRHGKCRLTIRIGITEYRLLPLPPQPRVLAAWVLRKLGPVEAIYQVSAPKSEPARCTCPDHERSGWTCKHIGALTAAGLIPAPKPPSARKAMIHAQARGEKPVIAPAPVRRPIGPGPGQVVFDPPVRVAPEDQNEGWVAGGAHLGHGGMEICDECGSEFDMLASRHPMLCPSCVKGIHS
jgi:hypothetical protein